VHHNGAHCVQSLCNQLIVRPLTPDREDRTLQHLLLSAVAGWRLGEATWSSIAAIELQCMLTRAFVSARQSASAERSHERSYLSAVQAGGACAHRTALQLVAAKAAMHADICNNSHLVQLVNQ
jgi:hypothetical protein